MKASMCDREEAVVRAVRTGFWPDDLRAHAAECDGCGEAMLLAATLREADAGEPVTVPEAGLVWWRAELRLKRSRAERALRPVVVAEGVTAAAVCTAIGTGVVLLSGTSTMMVVAAVATMAVLAVIAGSALAVAMSRK